jgi:16S rRNA (cytosine1402-N4)-methyltransferase
MSGSPPSVPPVPGHKPVLVDEVVAGLAIVPGEVHVDGTFGAGGYTRAMLGAGAGRVIAFDRDPSAIRDGPSLVPDSLKDGGRLTLVHDRFSRMAEVLEEMGAAPVDGITLDIGVSSMQIDQRERGFSFKDDGPLDMRMDQDGPTAADFLNTADEAEIARVIRDYGDEPRARSLARAIVAARPLTRTSELSAVCRKVLGWHAGMKTDPATRTFQAIRIHVNAELEELEAGLQAAERSLKPGGRLAVVTFHSLEDRIVKQFLKVRSGAAPAGSRHRPAVAAGPAPTFREVAKPVAPGEAELTENPRARSARLRTAVRTDAPATSRKAA